MEGEKGLARLNTFSNDGSFMEMFLKVQQERKKKGEGGGGGGEGVEQVPAPAISIKLGEASKNKNAVTATLPKTLQSKAARTAFGGDSDSDEENEGASRTERKGSATPTTAGATPTAAHTQSIAPSQESGRARAAATTQSGSRKRCRSKWDVPSSDSSAVDEAISSFLVPNTVQSSTGQGQQLTSAQQQQLKEQIEMNRLVAEIKAATQKSSSKKNKYEYDSDEDVEEGTWEHKARIKEMRKTEREAQKLTEAAKGKHHIGDFLPPDEVEKFVETVVAVKEDRDPDFSDYKDHKLADDNKGFQLLQKAGWSEGKGLGSQGQGITAPINKGKQTFDQSGVGAAKPAEVKKEDDEFELYRKRMMLAYRFRPNPLNNPRRTYY